MNATVQSLRAIPELQVALSGLVCCLFIRRVSHQNCRPSLQSTTPLPNALRELFSRMSQTTDNIVPSKFLEVLREVQLHFIIFFTLFIQYRSILNLLRWTAVRKRPPASLWVDQCTLNKVGSILVMPENICRLHLRRCGGVLFGYHQHSSKCTWIGWHGEK